MNDETIPRDLALRFLGESESVVYLRADAGGRVLAWNPAAGRRLGLTDGEMEEASLWEHVPEQEVARLRDAGDRTGAAGRRRVSFVDSRHHAFTLSCLVVRDPDALHILGEEIPGERERLQDDLLQLNRELSVLNRERARKSRELARTKEKLEAALEELETSYWHLKKVQEVIPMCMHCQRIRGDDASWEKVAEYFRSNSIFVSHGLCPDCAERFYAEESPRGEGEGETQ